MTLLQTQKFFDELCFARDFSCDDKTLLEKMPPAMAKSWLKISETRREIYRKLVFANVKDILNFVFEKTFSYVESALQEQWMRAYLAEYHIQSRHYYKIPVEFFNFTTEKHFFEKAGHDFLKDLADYEYHRWWLYQKPQIDWNHHNDKNLSLIDAVVVLNPYMTLKTYDFAVQKISEKNVVQEKTRLVLYRDPETFLVHTYVLNELSQKFLKSLCNQNQKLGQVIENFLTKNENCKNEFGLEEILAFLQKLIQMKIVFSLKKE